MLDAMPDRQLSDSRYNGNFYGAASFRRRFTWNLAYNRRKPLGKGLTTISDVDCSKKNGSNRRAVAGQRSSPELFV